MNYDTGGQNAGYLTLGESIAVASAEISFNFYTWYDTEPGAEYDQKTVEVSTNGGTTWSPIAGIIDPFDINGQTGKPWGEPFFARFAPSVVLPVTDVFSAELGVTWGATGDSSMGVLLGFWSSF